MGASEPDPPSQPQIRNTNSGQPSESFSYKHRRKLQNRLAQRRYRDKLKRRIDVEDDPEDRPCQEHTIVHQEPVSKRNTPALLGHEEITLESCMNITDELLQDCQDDWDIAECFDDMDNFTEIMQCNQDLVTYQEQGQFNHTSSALVSTSDNNVLQNGVHPAAHNQAQKQKCRATADQNGGIGAQVPPQRHLPRRTVSSSQAFSNTNRGGPAPDCTRELQDLSPQDETGHPERRAGNVLSLGKLLSEDPGCPQKTTGPGPGFQCSNHHENHGLPRHRARTWSNCSSKQHPSSSSYQEKLTTKANKLFSDLSQLYKFGVELDMIHYDEGFIQDLSTVKERFRQLADPGLIDLDQGNDDDTDQSRAKPGQNFAAAPHSNRRIAESQRQHLEINPPNPDPRDSTTKATYQESNLDRYRHDIHQSQGNSRVSTGHSSPRWTPSIIPESSEGSSLRTPSGLRMMQEYRADNSHKAGSRHEN